MDKDIGEFEDEAWAHHRIPEYDEESFRAGFRAAAHYASNETERFQKAYDRLEATFNKLCDFVVEWGRNG